jgi:hypothetical protein
MKDSHACRSMGWDWIHMALRPLFGLLYQPQMIDDDGWMRSNRWSANWRKIEVHWEEACPSATSSTINNTWPDLGSNLGRRGGKPANNRLSYGMAYTRVYLSVWYSHVTWCVVAASLQTTSFNLPQWKKSNGVRSGEWGGHDTFTRATHRCGKHISRTSPGIRAGHHHSCRYHNVGHSFCGTSTGTDDNVSVKN